MAVDTLNSSNIATTHRITITAMVLRATISQKAILSLISSQEQTLLPWRKTFVSIIITPLLFYLAMQVVTRNYDQKLDNLYFKSVLADKFLLYEDDNLKVGCLRSVSAEWRLITLKLFLANKSQTAGVEGI